MAALDSARLRSGGEMQPLVRASSQLDAEMPPSAPRSSETKRRRRRLRSLAKGGGDSSGSNSSSEASSDDREAPGPSRHDRDASRLPNWEVIAGFGIALNAIAILVYYLFFDSASSSASPVTAPSAQLASPSSSVQTTLELTSSTSAGVESEPAMSSPTMTRSALTTASSASAQSSVSSSSFGGTKVVADSKSSTNIDHESAIKASPTTSSTPVSGGDGEKSGATGETYKGKATFYFQNGNAGACGNKNPDDALICALQTEIYAGGKNCGKKVQITRTSGKGGSITVTVADECPSCEGTGYVDLSAGAYDKLGSRDEGMFDISWKFVS